MSFKLTSKDLKEAIETISTSKIQPYYTLLYRKWEKEGYERLFGHKIEDGLLKGGVKFIEYGGELNG